MSIQDFFDQMEDGCCPTTNNAGFAWTAKGVGFGEFYFYFDDSAKTLKCSNECMSKDFIKEMLCTMVDGCVLDDE